MNPADLPMPRTADACRRAIRVSVAVRRRLQARLAVAYADRDYDKAGELRATLAALEARERAMADSQRELPPELARQLLALKRAIKAQFGEETLVSLLAESSRLIEAEDAAREMETPDDEAR